MTRERFTRRAPEFGPITCPLCGSHDELERLTAFGREFVECALCRLTYLLPSHLLPDDDERARYETHRNDPADAGYRAFLERLRAPLVKRLEPGDEGLDYGSGPGPALSVMLEESGFPTAIYDPFFADDPVVLRRWYDFITCTETAEHFHHPGAELDRLDRLLRPGGWLGIMTTPRSDDTDFRSWWYARDPTHVCFYRLETMRWIAERFAWDLEQEAPTVFLFHKRPSGA